MGAPARRQAAANPHNTFSSVKRIIGRPFAAVQAELRSLPYAVVRSFDGSAELWCPAWCARARSAIVRLGLACKSENDIMTLRRLPQALHCSLFIPAVLVNKPCMRQAAGVGAGRGVGGGAATPGAPCGDLPGGGGRRRGHRGAGAL